MRKGYEHPEVAIQMINYLIAYEQTWIAEGKVDGGITSDMYPLFNVYDNADEIEYSYEWLQKFNLGEVAKEDVDITGRKLLKGDLDAIEVLKLDPKDDFSIEYWDYSTDVAKIILGQAPIEEFDKFVEKWYAEGGQEIINEVAENVGK